MDASVINFSVQSNGYAKNAFNTYYKGNKIAFNTSGKLKKMCSRKKRRSRKKSKLMYKI